MDKELERLLAHHYQLERKLACANSREETERLINELTVSAQAINKHFEQLTSKEN